MGSAAPGDPAGSRLTARLRDVPRRRAVARVGESFLRPSPRAGTETPFSDAWKWVIQDAASGQYGVATWMSGITMSSPNELRACARGPSYLRSAYSVVLEVSASSTPIA
ncbi:hypothetical protein Mame01_40630 [Microbispora amethystogenes]|nr:hypothetical protein Mame01_40630 [Microbispora amethystogenes]